MIRRAGPGDAAALGLAGVAAYAETYARLWDDPAAYLDQLATFAEPAFAAQLADECARVWLAEVRGRTVGFLTLAPGMADPVEAAAGGAEVGRLYLIAPCRGAGLGRRMVEAAAVEARAAGARYLWLDAMRSERRAWEAYRRWGFRVIGEKLFERPVRADERPMLVLRRDL